MSERSTGRFSSSTSISVCSASSKLWRTLAASRPSVSFSRMTLRGSFLWAVVPSIRSTVTLNGTPTMKVLMPDLLASSGNTTNTSTCSLVGQVGTSAGATMRSLGPSLLSATPSTRARAAAMVSTLAAIPGAVVGGGGPSSLGTSLAGVAGSSSVLPDTYVFVASAGAGAAPDSACGSTVSGPSLRQPRLSNAATHTPTTRSPLLNIRARLSRSACASRAIRGSLRAIVGSASVGDGLVCVGGGGLGDEDEGGERGEVEGEGLREVVA